MLLFFGHFYFFFKTGLICLLSTSGVEASLLRLVVEFFLRFSG